MELVKIDASEYGITESKAQEISAQFKPMLDKMVELEKEANEVFKMKKGTPESEEKAKEVRLKLVKVRTGTAEIHKAQKAFYLAGGRFVDGWKNAQLFASQGLEEKLMEIESFTKRKEAERVEKLNVKRTKIIEQYINLEDVDLNFGAMSEEVWEAYLAKKKKDYEELKEAERQAEIQKQIQEAKKEEGAKRLKQLIPLANYLENDLASYDLVEMSQEIFEALMEGANRVKLEVDRKAEEQRLENERLKAEYEEKERRRKLISQLLPHFDGVCYMFQGIAYDGDVLFNLELKDFEKELKVIEGKVTKERARIEEEQKAEKEKNRRWGILNRMFKNCENGEYDYDGIKVKEDYALSLKDQDFDGLVERLKGEIQALKEKREERMTEANLYRGFIDADFEELLAMTDKAYQSVIKKAKEDKKAEDLRAKKAKEAQEEADRIIEAQRQQKLAEEQAEADRKAEEERLAKAGDKERMRAWVEGMLIKGLGAEGMADGSVKVAEDIIAKFGDFKAWALKQVEKI